MAKKQEEKGSEAIEAHLRTTGKDAKELFGTSAFGVAHMLEHFKEPGNHACVIKTRSGKVFTLQKEESKILYNGVEIEEAILRIGMMPEDHLSGKLLFGINHMIEHFFMGDFNCLLELHTSKLILVIEKSELRLFLTEVIDDR